MGAAVVVVAVVVVLRVIVEWSEGVKLRRGMRKGKGKVRRVRQGREGGRKRERERRQRN